MGCGIEERTRLAGWPKRSQVVTLISTPSYLSTVKMKAYSILANPRPPYRIVSMFVHPGNNTTFRSYQENNTSTSKQENINDGLEQPIANWAKRREGGRDRDRCSEASGIRYSRSLSYSGVIALEEGPVDPWHIYYTPSPPNTATPPNPPSQDHHTSSFLRLVCFIALFF